MPQDKLHDAHYNTHGLAFTRGPSLTERIEALEKNAHKPFDFTKLIERIEALETAVSVAVATPAAVHRAREAQYQYAKLAWEKIKSNLSDRDMYDNGSLDRELEREIDEEQIEAIRAHMGGTDGK